MKGDNPAAATGLKEEREKVRKRHIKTRGQGVQTHKININKNCTIYVNTIHIFVSVLTANGLQYRINQMRDSVMVEGYAS